MKSSNSNPRLREGDEVQTEWSKFSYDLWCREQAQEYLCVPGMKIVDLYEVVRSVIEKDFSPAEQFAAKLHWYEGLSVNQVAEQAQVSNANIYKALSRGKEKIRLVLKHLIDCKEFTINKQ